MVRRARGERIAGPGRLGVALRGKKMRKCQRAEAASVTAQKGTPAQMELTLFRCRHGTFYSTYKKALLASTIWQRSAQARSAPSFCAA